MTKQERVIVSAYTGFLMCDFSDIHEYIEKIMGRPVWTHELAMKSVMDEIRQKSKPDFLALCQGEISVETSKTGDATASTVPSNFSFGDRLIYISPKNPDLKTRCAFIRDDGGRAVVMFIHAEWAARVNYRYLSKEI